MLGCRLGTKKQVPVESSDFFHPLLGDELVSQQQYLTNLLHLELATSAQTTLHLDDNVNVISEFIQSGPQKWYSGFNFEIICVSVHQF